MSTTTPGGTTAGGVIPGSAVGSSLSNPTADSVVMHRPRLSQLIGTNVYNDRNETIGEVDDIILAPPAGMGGATNMSGVANGASATGTTSGIAAGAPMGGSGSSATTANAAQGPVAIIQVGGFLGMGGRLVAVPLSDLHWNSERERVIMPNASKETLQGRPAFSYDALRRG